MKKSLDDYRFELNIYLRKADCPDPEKFIEGYEKVLKLSEPIKFRHIGILRVPEDVYKACQTKMIVFFASFIFIFNKHFYVFIH